MLESRASQLLWNQSCKSEVPLQKWRLFYIYIQPRFVVPRCCVILYCVLNMYFAIFAFEQTLRFIVCSFVSIFAPVSVVWATRGGTKGRAVGTQCLHLCDSVWPQECVNIVQVKGYLSLGQKNAGLFFSSCLDVSLTRSLLVYCWLTI